VFGGKKGAGRGLCSLYAWPGEEVYVRKRTKNFAWHRAETRGSRTGERSPGSVHSDRVTQRNRDEGEKERGQRATRMRAIAPGSEKLWAEMKEWG